jgi:hypothetical protein
LSSDEPQNIGEIQVDTANLYREEVFTDLKVASIRKLVPILPDGSPDPARDPLFTGQTTLMTQAGPVPVTCPIDATTLEEATAKFPEAVKLGVERLMEEVREVQRREASRIVVPGQTGLPGPIPGVGGGKLDIS